MPTPKSRVDTLIGVVASHGLYHDKTRKLVRKYVDAGFVDATLEATTRSLLSLGFLNGSMPTNAGKKTPRVEHAARDAAMALAAEYMANRGYLVPRCISTGGLIQRILDLWKSTWAAPIPPGPELKSSEGLDARMCLAAQLVATSVKLHTDREERRGETIYVLAEEDFEGFCRSAVKAVMRAFNEAEDANHELIHAR